MGRRACSVDTTPGMLRGVDGSTGTDRLIGRHRELAALRAWLEATRDGSGRLVLCAGEPGIGKTRLAQEFAGSALASGADCGVGPLRRDRGGPGLLAVAPGPPIARHRPTTCSPAT